MLYFMGFEIFFPYLFFFFGKSLNRDYKKNWHVGDEFADSKLSNDYLSWFKLCSRFETLYYTVKSLKLMVKLFHNWVSSPWDGYPIKSAGCPHSLHSLWLGDSLAPALGIQSWNKAIVLCVNVGKIKISIYTFLLYLKFYVIAFILGGRLLLCHTYRWGTWGSIVLRGIYYYWFEFRPSSFDVFLSDLFMAGHSHHSGLFSNIPSQRGLSWLSHPEKHHHPYFIAFFDFHSTHHYLLVFFSFIFLLIFKLCYREENLVFFLVPHPSTVIVPDIQLMVKNI